MWIDIVGILLGLIGCGISVFIALRQDRQLAQLTLIEKDTSETAHKIAADDYKRDVVKKFFFAGKEPSKFKCLFPAEYCSKPLPSILAGDYYALHVLQELLAGDQLDLRPQSSCDNAGGDSLDGDLIFLCTPHANPALSRLAKPLELMPDPQECPVPWFDDIELPCWFANDIAPEFGGEKIKKIWVRETGDRLPSPSETEYHRSPVNGKKHVPLSDVQADYAILLRLSGTRRVIVIAGIHQYGTWIAGEFLRRLAIKDDKNKSIQPREKDLLLQDHDFLAIVWGHFRTSTLAVEQLGIHHNYIWIRTDTGWQLA